MTMSIYKTIESLSQYQWSDHFFNISSLIRINKSTWLCHIKIIYMTKVWLPSFCSSLHSPSPSSSSLWCLLSNSHKYHVPYLLVSGWIYVITLISKEAHPILPLNPLVASRYKCIVISSFFISCNNNNYYYYSNFYENHVYFCFYMWMLYCTFYPKNKMGRRVQEVL